MTKSNFTRRGVLKTSAIAGAGVALPTIFTSRASAFTNEPTGSTVKFGFNVPQTGPYADEGLDELRAQELAIQHINGEGDGGMLNTFSSKALKGDGVLGKIGMGAVYIPDWLLGTVPVPTIMFVLGNFAFATIFLYFLFRPVEKEKGFRASMPAA